MTKTTISITIDSDLAEATKKMNRSDLINSFLKNSISTQFENKDLDCLRKELEIKTTDFIELQTEINNIRNKISAIEMINKKEELELIKKEQEIFEKTNSCAWCGNKISKSQEKTKTPNNSFIHLNCFKSIPANKWDKL